MGSSANTSMRVFFTALLATFQLSQAVFPTSDFMMQRQQLIQAERNRAIGGSIALTIAEQRADQVITRAKQQELPPIRITQLPSVHFFDAKEDIERSVLFGLLQRMPKGAALHVHSDSNVAVEWLIANATYDDTLY